MNPTVETVDLSRNGLDNEAVSLFTAIARRHLGITSLNLSHNPITQLAGKELFALVEENTRITDLSLEGTQAYEGLVRRIHLSVNRNRELHQLQPRLREHNIAPRPAQTKMGGAATRRPQPPSTRPAAAQRPAPQPGADDAAVAEGVPTAAGVPAGPRVPAAPNKPTPRPTPPCMASSGYRRMTPEEREQARGDYHRCIASQSGQLTEQLRDSVERSVETDSASAAGHARRKMERLAQEQQSVEREREHGHTADQQAELAALKDGRAAATAALVEQRHAQRVQRQEGVDASAADAAEGGELAFLSDEAKELIAAQGRKSTPRRRLRWRLSSGASASS